MDLHLQDPTARGLALLDVTAESGKDADRGGGIFAFASAYGIAALLDDKKLRRLTSTAGFELVVGMDAITDVAALDLLADRVRRPALRGRVLVHGLQALFHPKLCWFVRGERLTLVVGSGNLTRGGLASNFEAFTVTELSGAAARDVETQILAWLTRWDGHLLAPDDPLAQARAQLNAKTKTSLVEITTPKPLPGPTPDADTRVLVLEIPRNDDGRAQIDMGERIFREFFGGVPGKEKRVLIQHVDAAGRHDELERPRELIGPTSSSNYRIEAGAGRGRAYPARGAGRPIGVFLPQVDGVFRYRLLWPGEAGHAEVDKLLDAIAGPWVRSMRRERVTPAQLRAAWPHSPLLIAGP